MHPVWVLTLLMYVFNEHLAIACSSMAQSVDLAISQWPRLVTWIRYGYGYDIGNYGNYLLRFARFRVSNASIFE